MSCDWVSVFLFFLATFSVILLSLAIVNGKKSFSSYSNRIFYRMLCREKKNEEKRKKRKECELRYNCLQSISSLLIPFLFLNCDLQLTCLERSTEFYILRTIKKSRTHVEHIDSKNRFSQYSVQKFTLTCCSPTMQNDVPFSSCSFTYVLFFFIFSLFLSVLFLRITLLCARNLNLLSVTTTTKGKWQYKTSSITRSF